MSFPQGNYFLNLSAGLNIVKEKKKKSKQKSLVTACAQEGLKTPMNILLLARNQKVHNDFSLGI